MKTSFQTRKITLILIGSLFIGTGILNSQVTDLRDLWNSDKVCKNPDKGWYEHYYDNTQSDATLDSFPGMDHLYIRLSWAHFEPKEGQFDWHWIDDLVNHWVPKGYKISFSLISKNADGEIYATPKWVADAGARGDILENMWCPYYDDPVFMAKLTAFHKAVAARYDGKPWLSYVDLGGIGTWGEGHEYPAGNQPSVATVKKIIDMYASTYKKTLVVSLDDMAGYSRPQVDEEAIAQYSESKGFSWRDDTPLVVGVPTPCPDGIMHPYLFEDVYKRLPTVLEADQGSSNQVGAWLGQDGSRRGADLLLCAMRTMHATYIGVLANKATWLKENPNLTRQIANECGYWFFPRSITIPENLTAKLTGTWKIVWENHGVAPAYHPYVLEIRIGNTFVDTLKTSDCRTWPSKGSKEESYTITLPSGLSAGTYPVSVRLTDPRSGRNVELALKNDVRDAQGFYKLADVNISRRK
jgi:hypothetical protein